jgi:hypothetical protein
MTKVSLHESLRQNQSVTEQTHATFAAFIQQTVREMVVAAMQDEVTSYCGAGVLSGSLGRWITGAEHRSK